MKLDEPQLDIQPLTARRRRNEWIALALAMVVLTAALGAMVFEDRASIAALERNRLQTQARVIEENLVRQLQAVSSVLARMRYDLFAGDNDGAGDAEGERLRLKTLADALPGVRAIYAVDSQGLVISAEQKSLIGQTAQDRPYFTVPRDRPDDSLIFVSPPYLSIRGNYVINLSKSMTGPDGRFAGITTAVLDQSYFEILARSVLYAPDMTVNISHADGEVFLIAPSYARAVGTNQNDPGSPFLRHRASGSAANLYEESAKDTAQPRMLALQSVTPPTLHLDKPLVITVARPLSAIYGKWQQGALVYASFWSLLLAAAALALFFSQSRRSTLAAARAAVQAVQRETAQRFEFGLKGADLGLWDWNLVEDRMVINERQWQILGYEPGEVALTSAFWQSLLHPDDWVELETAFAAHLRHGAPAYKLEHRLRHKQGHWVWVLDHAMVIERSPGGRARRVLGTHLDITARKEAEEIQRDTAQRLELAMHSGNIGLLDWHLGSGTLILNALGHGILGRVVDRPEDAPISAAEWEALRHPEDNPAVREAQAELVSGARQAADIEYRMRHADGHYLTIHMRAEIVARDTLDRPLRLVGIFRDVSERKLTETALADAMALQRRTGELARVGGWELDLAAGTTVWTDEVYRIYELPPGRPLALAQSLAGYARESRARLEAALQQATRQGIPWDMELQMTTALGRQIWVRSRCEVVSVDGKPQRLIGTIQDTTERMTVQLELERANAQLAELSMTDGLTGVANRRRFDQAIGGEWPRSVRQQLPLALLMIDIDYFKAYNDAMGHQGGDACLREVAHVLARCAWRPGELLARYGGEEFCILLPDSTLADARVVAQRCLDRLEQARIPHPASPTSQWLTISIGVASMVPAVGTLADALLEQADAALYAAKRAGRARFECAGVGGDADVADVATEDAGAGPPAA